ncbi:NADH-quinone oxidoreductase subunit L [Parachitinimonas caeni]|uniref:Probable inorganic carbon transporter subunit DabB n=1 Tax=Parachitinimonas caeni TaxID=3031301 RepID=A0ABT7DSJ5_9NEIS|nr:NADH-quinone oxidoreductase subunit L [Parachitinimonas caeni]MDK2123048.1 NADH-quinone oxidoreductase subunit L [Parachitinimonas caeni]
MALAMQWLCGLLPLGYLLAWGLARLWPSRSWQLAETGALAGLASVAVTALVQIVQPAGAPKDWPGLLVAGLIALLGWIIVRYSRTSLMGEAGQLRYLSALLLTLAAVSSVVLSPHLGMLVAAWAVSSLGLHPLLTFYRERVPAQIVAHKKFLVSRMAEVCLLLALWLIHRDTGSLWLADLASHLAALDQLTTGLHLAAALIALAAILKSAQLPLHGWLIQVMEAPTPVSALLHAGIVNLGGFVLIRLAELLSLAPAAQVLLIGFGSVTAVLAGLVMMTRISIKVRLAWSTCAQMGFMLMECGLGLYELALLHLLAHSLYKAHAFLTAGQTVQLHQQRTLVSDQSPLSPDRQWQWAVAAPVLSGLLVAGSAYGWQLWQPAFAPPVVAIAVLSLGLAPLLWPVAPHCRSSLATGCLRLLALTQLYLLWHLAFSQLVPTHHAPGWPATLWVITSLGGLYLAQSWLRSHPDSALSRRLYPWAYAGFYLDERYTRFVFRVWPVRLATPAN